MKSINLISLISIALILLLFQCDKKNAEPKSRSAEVTLNCDEQPNLCLLSDSNNDFGLDLFRRLSSETPEENIFISPTSIATALSMTMNGAAGQTLADMRQTLKQGGLNPDELNAANQALLEALPKMDISVKATMANSIWYKEGFSVLPDFIATNEEYYNSEVQALDFDAPNAKDSINDWVEDKTEGRIDDIIDQIDPEEVMFLINAIYFKGDWKEPFDEKKTAPAPFYLADGNSVEVDMMHLDETPLPYFTDDQVHVVDLAYGDGEAFSMTIILPKENVSPDALLQDLGSIKWNNWIDHLTETSIGFNMPKFDMTYNKNLNETLKAMGMQRAFDKYEADFSRINQDLQLFISKVQHKAFIEVNEKGTEAAAATSVGVGVTSLPPTITVDRPFLFAIRDRQAKNILFLGRVMNPTKN